MADGFKTWPDGLSTWQHVLLSCAFFIAIAWLGTLLVHPLLRRLMHAEHRMRWIIHSASNFGLVGHPSALVASQMSACPTILVAITGPVVARLVDTYPFYVRGSIPAGNYRTFADIPTSAVARHWSRRRQSTHVSLPRLQKQYWSIAANYVLHILLWRG